MIDYSCFETMEEDEGYKLLERKSVNDRTLICWYNPKEQQISLALFHTLKNFKGSSLYSRWGYPTYYVGGMYTEDEAAEVVSLYIKDMEADNCWWETK